MVTTQTSIFLCCIFLCRAIDITHCLSDTSHRYSYIAIYKPPLTLCTLNDDGPRSARKNRGKRSTLADLGLEEGLHVCGRLDRDSEGLLLLTDNGLFTHKVLSEACHKTYWTLVQGTPTERSLEEMRRGGLEIRAAITRPPIEVSRLDSSEVTEMLPPACLGMDRPGTWLKIVLNEGRNRQVRRVTAAAGHSTIRLVRVAIGALNLFDTHLLPGEWIDLDSKQVLGEAYP
jgi:23S rRNA pseudouridine2457 synthase